MDVMRIGMNNRVGFAGLWRSHALWSVSPVRALHRAVPGQALGLLAPRLFTVRARTDFTRIAWERALSNANSE